MEDIEYLDEYKDLVLPGIKSGAPPASSAGVPRQRRISSDSSNSSSIDADIFQKLFHGKYLDDELLNEGSGSKSQDRRRRSPTSSSSDESNDALEALFRGKSSQSKPTKRRERYESFDSVDDLGEALMRPSHKLSVLKPSTSQASSKKSQDVAPHRSISNSSSSNVGKSLPATSSQTYASAKNKKINSVANKTTLSANGDRLASAKNKTVTIVKPQKTDLTSSRHEPKTDPLTLGDLYGDSDSDSSYEYESDFYGDRDSDEEDEPVIDISTDTSRTTSVAEAAKRKQRPDMEKSLTGKKEPVKPARRRQLADEEERPSLKRSKMESESKSSVQGKFISIIGNETIMSSTTAPSLETKGETTSPASRKSAVQESKHVEIIKHVILGTPAKKLHHPDSPAAEVKKPMVQTLLSSTLSLHKPSTAESSSPLKVRKSLKKLNADENVVGDQSIYSSSIAFPKKTSAVAPRKVNISVSLLQTKDTEVDTLTTAASKSEAFLLTKKAQLETQKSTKKSEGNKKTESKKKSTVQGLQMKSLKSEETESSKKTVAAAVTGRKPLPQLEVSTKPESRKSEGSSSESNPRKDPSQVQRFSKMDSRKSEGTALSATARKRLTQPEVSKSEAASKAAETDNIVQAAKIEAMSKGRGPQKKSKTDQRKSKPKTEVRSLEEEASTDPMDSSRSDISDNPGTFAESQGIFNMPGHMNRAVSSNRSLAPTPTPISDRQRNSSKERFTPVSDQKKAMRQAQTLVKPRGRGGRNQQLDLKRKAGDAEDGTEVINPKRPRELQEEDPPEQDVHVRESAFVAFPVKITAASAVNPTAVRSAANTIPQKAKLRKLCVKMNRRPFNKWLRSMQEKNETQEGSRNVTLLPPHGETSETDSAAESMSESMLQPQVESSAVTQPQPASQPDSYPAPTSELEKEESSAQLAPIAANEPPANNDSSTAPASNIAPENEQTVNPPAKTTLKTAIYPLTEKQLPDETALLESARKLAEQRRVQMFHAKSMPLPVPILEVKSEPEDVTDEHPPNEPLQAVATAPAILPPNSITEDAVPATIQISPLDASTSSRPPELHSIPSASAPDGNPNAIGQTKMFSFLYPKRYKRSYDDVGLDFCCPNLDGPMRAIDFTRLHSKAEVPVLEVPQFLVITTKFISKADKNMPSKVRAKLELLGRAKERDSTNLTPTGSTPTADATAPSSFPHAPASVGPATQPFPSIIHNLLSAPLPAPGSFNIPTCVDPSTSTPVVPTSSSPSCLDSLSKQLPRGTTLTKKSVQAVATIPSLVSTSIAHNMAPSLIQLPPICPKDKQRVELQARVQVFDMVLQTLSRRAANLSLSERQRTIEEIVRTSSLMAIDVDVGTKLLENYVHYLNKATSTQSNSMATSVTANPSSLGASAGSTLSKSIVSSTTASSDIPPQGTNRSGEHVQMRSSLPATMPLYDGDHTSDFQFTPSKSTAGRMSASTSHAAAALGKVQPRSTQGMQKSFAGNTSQFVNLNTTVSMPAPRMNAKKPALCKKKTSPVRTLPNTTSLPTARAKTNASLSAVLGETPAAEFVSPAGMSLSTTGNPNVFIINHALQSEESILPDSNSSVGHLETEIKGELDDSTEVII